MYVLRLTSIERANPRITVDALALTGIRKILHFSFNSVINTLILK